MAKERLIAEKDVTEDGGKFIVIFRLYRKKLVREEWVILHLAYGFSVWEKSKVQL